jgi:hypothetical protein
MFFKVVKSISGTRGADAESFLTMSILSGALEETLSWRLREKVGKKTTGAGIGEHMIAETQTELYLFFAAARMSRRFDRTLA